MLPCLIFHASLSLFKKEIFLFEEGQRLRNGSATRRRSRKAATQWLTCGELCGNAHECKILFVFVIKIFIFACEEP